RGIDRMAATGLSHTRTLSRRSDTSPRSHSARLMLCCVDGEYANGRAVPQRRSAHGGLVLFRLAGVPVVLAPSWWIGSLLVVVLYAPLVARVMPGADTLTAWLLAAAFAVLLGLSVLAHELGHCLVALRLRLPVRRLRLYLLGGLAEISRTP